MWTLSVHVVDRAGDIAVSPHLLRGLETLGESALDTGPGLPVSMTRKPVVSHKGQQEGGQVQFWSDLC